MCIFRLNCLRASSSLSYFSFTSKVNIEGIFLAVARCCRWLSSSIISFGLGLQWAAVFFLNSKLPVRLPPDYIWSSNPWQLWDINLAHILWTCGRLRAIMLKSSCLILVADVSVESWIWGTGLSVLFVFVFFKRFEIAA